MSALLLTAPAVEPLTLAEAKAFLRVEHTYDDDVIAALIAAARIHVEAQTRRALITQVWRVTRDAWPSDGRLVVSPAPLQALNAAQVIDREGDAQAIDLQHFVVDSAGSTLSFAPWAVPQPCATAQDVRAMRIDEAKAIYRARYWDALSCDELPAGVDEAVFDYGVNSGIGRSGKVLRRVLGLADNTGVVTAAVIAAARKADAKQVVNAVCDERLRFLKGLKAWSVFGKGWGRRVAAVRSAALALTLRASPPAAPSSEPAEPHQQPAARGLLSVLLSILSAWSKRGTLLR